MGLLYFYDEELVDVDEEDENGNVQTVTKKKIIQKQLRRQRVTDNLPSTEIKWNTQQAILL